MKKGGVLNLLNKLENMDLEAIAQEALQNTSSSIDRANKDQLFAGLRSDGSEILPDYKDETIMIKDLKGQPTDRVTLFDEGDFYAGIRTEVTDGKVITDSFDPKTEKLKKKYDGDKRKSNSGSILGIGGKYKKDYIAGDLQIEFSTLVENASGLKMNK